jgi:hypothetical protein
VKKLDEYLKIAETARFLGVIADTDKRFTLSATDIAALSPKTRNGPTFRSRHERRVPASK